MKQTIEMKPKLIELAKILWKVPNIEKREVIGIMNPLESIEQIQQLIDWLNQQDITKLKITPIYYKVDEIVGRKPTYLQNNNYEKLYNITKIKKN